MRKNIEGNIWAVENLLFGQIQSLSSDVMNICRSEENPFIVSTDNFKYCRVKSSCVPDLPRASDNSVFYVYGDSSESNKSVLHRVVQEKKEIMMIFDLICELTTKINEYTRGNENHMYLRSCDVCKPKSGLIKGNNFTIKFTKFNEYLTWQFLELGEKIFVKRDINLKGLPKNHIFNRVINDDLPNIEIDSKKLYIPRNKDYIGTINTTLLWNDPTYKDQEQVDVVFKSFVDTFYQLDKHLDGIDASVPTLNFKDRMCNIKEYSF